MTTPTASTPDRPDDVRARIHREAARYAEAMVYSMNNPYLTRHQKALVEAWYQFPIGLFGYLLLGYLAIKSPEAYLSAFLIAYGIAAAVSLLNWIVSLPTPILVTLGLLFAGWIETAISLVFMLFFLYHGAWVPAGLAVASACGVLSIVSPTVHLYAMLSRGRMHFKYRFAKRRFGITFPFENN